MSKPIAVLTADVHYNLSTYPIAGEAMEACLAHAERLKIPLVIAGDLHDTKAAMRGEVVSAMLKTFSSRSVPIYILAGNHDRLNEKSPEHALEFLKPYCRVIEAPTFVECLGSYLVPYYSDIVALKALLASLKAGSRLIAHQGIQGSNMGHYVQDKTALSQSDFAPFHVISGHYHQRQCIDTKKGNKFDYIGNPYTLTFGEANDGPKGYQVLYDDGSLRFYWLMLKRHVILDITLEELSGSTLPALDPNNHIWIKLRGNTSKLAKVKKQAVAERFRITNFKFDKIPTDTTQVEIKADTMTDEGVLDALIDGLQESTEQKLYLKTLWKDLVSS